VRRDKTIDNWTQKWLKLKERDEQLLHHTILHYNTLHYLYLRGMIKEFWEELTVHIPWYDTGHIENDASNNSSIVAYSLPR
jgi:hypothetical protein